MTKKYTITIIIVLCLVLAAAVAVIIYWVRDLSPREIVSAEMQANMSDAAGVELTSAFTISFTDSVVATAVRRSLSVEPPIELGVHQGKERDQVLVVPAEPLQAGTLYTFSLAHDEAALSWVFQTRNQLSVSSHTPLDRQNAVSGQQISFTLNQLLYADLSRIDAYFSLTPQVDGEFTQQGRQLIFTAEQSLTPGAVYRVELAAGLPFLDASSVLDQGVSFSFAAAAPAATWTLSGANAYLSGSQPQFALSFDAPLPAVSDAEALSQTTERQPGEQTALAAPFEVQLYAFTQADDYATLLADIIKRQPYWSEGFAALSDCDLSRAELLTSFSQQPQAGVKAHSFSLPAPLADGNYLLRVLYRGQSRDLPFAVSPLSAYILPHSSGALLWLHDSVSAQPLVGATLRDSLSQVSAESDADGVALLSGLGEAAVCRITTGEDSLILPLWQLSAPTAAEPELWRYLYLSQDEYQNGDELHFFGLVKPRDGSQLEYAGVSVYIFDSDQAAVLRQYAELSQDCFSGAISLPQLPPGDYRLAVWQSGRELVSCPFSMAGATRQTTLPEAVAAASTVPGAVTPSLDSTAYEIGDSYAVSCDLGAGDYLCLSLQPTALSWSEGSLFAGSFAPKNLLNSYCAMLCYNGGSYKRSGLAQLRRDYNAQALQLQIDDAEAGELVISLTDPTGAPVAQQQLALSLCSGQQPAAAPLDAIYNDYSDSGLLRADNDLASFNGAQPVYAYDGECLWFSLVNTDENGQARLSLPAASTQQQCWLLAQAVSSSDEGVRSGSATQLITAAGQGNTDTDIDIDDNDYAEIDVETDGGDEANASATSPPLLRRELSWQGGLTAQGAVVEGDGADGLLLVAAADQTQALLLLAQALCGEDELSSRAAAAVLLDYSGDMMADLLNGFDPSLEDWRPETATVTQAALLALLQPAGVSPHALRQYLLSVLDTAATDVDYAAALAGLAALGQPLLNETRLLLQAADLAPQQQAWLVLSLALSGDGTAVAQLDWPTPDSGADCALLALTLAGCGDDAQALTYLHRAALSAQPQEYLLYQTAAAQLLLHNAATPPATRLVLQRRLADDYQQQPPVYNLSYSIANAEYSTSFAASSKFQLPLTAFADILTIHSTDGGGYCCLSAAWTETEAAGDEAVGGE